MVPGSQIREVLATVKVKGQTDRTFSMYRFRSYDPKRVSELLTSLGWEEHASVVYGERHADFAASALLLFTRRPEESAARLNELHKVQQVPVESCTQLRQTGPHHPLSQHRCMPIPDSFPIPTCSRCHAKFFDVRTTEALAPLLHERYQEQLRQRAIEILMLHISQRRFELLIGLSQGYLSRLRIGAGNPSAELVSHLAMLAHAPKTRLAELERYWAVSVGRL